MMDLKSIVSEMRELGIEQLKTPEYEIVLGSPPAPAPTQKPKPDAEVESIEREREEWDRVWAKATRSSGAAIPPFPKKRM